MELPIIIFILLFILVIILILLHLSNQKYADRISILEQALNRKIEDIPSLKQTYADAKQAIDEYESQERKIELQARNIEDLENTLKRLKESQLQVSTEKLEDMEKTRDNLMLEVTQIKELYNKEIEKTKTFEKSISIVTEKKELLEETIKNLSDKMVILEKEHEADKELSKSVDLQKSMEFHSINGEYNDVIHYMSKGHDIHEVAKHFDISTKRVELIAKFDKMKRQR